jgi:hypothetical protein
MYVATIAAGVSINGAIPLFYEIACETSYPVSEGLTGGLLTLVNNLIGIFFLLILYIPDIGRCGIDTRQYTLYSKYLKMCPLGIRILIQIFRMVYTLL